MFYWFGEFTIIFAFLLPLKKPYLTDLKDLIRFESYDKLIFMKEKLFNFTTL